MNKPIFDTTKYMLTHNLTAKALKKVFDRKEK